MANDDLLVPVVLLGYLITVVEICRMRLRQQSKLSNVPKK